MSTTTHRSWCDDHVVDGPDHDPTELDFCRREIPFPGGTFDLHDANGKTEVLCYIADAGVVEQGMTVAQATEFALALVKALILNSQSDAVTR